MALNQDTTDLRLIAPASLWICPMRGSIRGVDCAVLRNGFGGTSEISTGGTSVATVNRKAQSRRTASRHVICIELNDAHLSCIHLAPRSAAQSRRSCGDALLEMSEPHRRISDDGVPNMASHRWRAAYC